MRPETPLKKLLLVFIPYLIIGLIALFFIPKYLNIRDEVSELEDESIMLNNEISLIYNNMGIQFNSEDSKVNIDLRVINIEGDTLHLNNILSPTKPTLIFRFSTSFCQLCVEQEITNLNKLINETNKFEIIGISDFRDMGKYKNYVKLKSTRFETFNLIDPLSIELEFLQIPYLFVINNGPQATLVFLPLKIIQENSSRYYEILKSKF